MKHFILLLALIFTSLSARAQFSQAIGSPDNNFRATQIRTLGGNTYVSGWLTDVTAANANLSTEGVIVRLNPIGAIDWIYQITANTPAGVGNGSRIYDFDFDDDQANIVFVGATTHINGGMVDNECMVGMVDITTGAGIFQRTYDFRTNAREFFLRITNHPGTDATDANNYIISGLVNMNNGSVSLIDNYISARALITQNNVVFNWINENTYAGNNADDEMQRMSVLDVMGNFQVVHGGTSIPNNIARINFHSINNGNIINEFSLSNNGTVLDIGQIGNTMIVVGQSTNPNRAFIASVDLSTFTVTSSFDMNNFNQFSHLAIEPNSGDILVVGERNNDISAICSFNMVGTQLNYNGAVELDFGNDIVGFGLVDIAGNEAFFADTRNALATFGTNQSAAVFRTNLNFNTCNTNILNFTPQATNLVMTPNPGVDVDSLVVPNFVNLTLEQDTLCAISLCGDGFNLDALIPVFHNSRSHYVEVADVDDDGWMDFGVPEIRFGNTPRFNISTNNQNLTFTNTPSTTSSPTFLGDAESMRFINLDNAGNLDIVVQRQGRIEVYISNSTAGTYTIGQFFDVTVATPPFNGNTLGLFRSDFDLVDHDGDGDDDLVVTGASNGNGTEDRIAVFYGTGSNVAPFFSATPDVSMQGLPAIKYWQTIHVDIDGVQGNDLLLGQAGYGAAQQSVFGYLNTGNPAALFNNVPDLNYETPLGLYWPRGMDLIDIDGNTQNDLVVAMQGDSLNGGQVVGQGAVIIARDLPTGAGSYTNANLQWEIMNIPGNPVGVAIGDIDSDGDQDIAVAVHNGTAGLASYVRIYENNGNGNFFNFIDVETPIGQAVELEFADFNNDCCLDIVTTQWNGNMSYVLINDCQVTEFIIQGQVVCENDPCDFFGMTNGAPNQTIEVTDGTTTYIVTTDINGFYEVDVPAGAYTIGVANATYGDATCLNAFTADVTGFQPVTNLDPVNFFIEDRCILDVNMVAGIIDTTGGNLCPFVATPCAGLKWEYCFEIENNSCSDQVIDEITLDLPTGIDLGSIQVNPLVECVSQNQVSNTVPTITPLSNGPFGSTVIYNLNASLTIAAGECFIACVEADFIGNFTLPVSAQVNIEYSCGDDPGPPTMSGVSYPDTCSCDPNLKLAYFPQNCGSLDELLDQPIEYTIHFTNIGQSAAYDILVLDQLDNNLDWSTFQWLGSNHPTTSISLSSGLLEVYFNNINLAPGANGWLRFSVKSDGSTLNNTTIYNSADIIFDNNAPVSTNTTETLIQSSSAEAELQFNALEFCVGDKIVIDYTWTGDNAWLNFTQNGTPVGQNVPAPPSGSQIIFPIPDNSYVGLWEYELVAYDSITGCTDIASVTLQIYDCECDLSDQISMSVNGNSYTFESEVFDSALNPGFDIIDFKWHLGDGTISTDESPTHQYNCKKLKNNIVKVCFYYVAEINGQICEGQICQVFEVCQNDQSDIVNIYPNPANNQVTVQSEVLDGQDGVLTIEAYTIEGKLLEKFRLKSENDRIKLKFGDNYKGPVYIRILNHFGEVLLEDRFLKLNHATF